MTWQVEVRRYGDDGVEKVFGPYPRERNAERVEGGLNINLNHEAFYTVIVPLTARPGSSPAADGGA